MTLITEYHSGHTRRCDAKCHDGKHDKCKCICGGANHGKGLRQAMENTQAMAEDLLKREGIKINSVVGQESIVPGDDLIFECQGETPVCNVPYLQHLHSQEFEWGYGGSGPADLALNILLECGVSKRDALDLHQDFKFEFIAPMPLAGGRINRQVVKDWAKARGAKVA